MLKTVLYVVDSLGLSGKTLGLVNLALNLDPDRYRSAVASLAPPEGMLVDRLRASGVPVMHVPNRDGLNAAVVARLVRLVRAVSPAVVHCFNPRPMLYGGLAAAFGARPAIGTLSAFACMSARMRYSFLPQPLMTRSRRNRIRNRISGRLLRRLSAVTRRAGETFCDDNAIPRRKLRVISYGVDLRELDRVDAEDIARLRAEIGARPGELVVGSVGRLVEQKDYPTQLRAFAIARSRSQMRMAIAGSGPLEPELRALAHQLGISDRVCWLGERRDIWTVLRSIDAFVIASKFEPFGVAVLEAMAAGLPIIATAVNDLPEILDGGRAGLLVPAERPEALAAALSRVMCDTNLRERMAQRARAVATSRYSLPAVVTAFQELYDDVIGG